MKEKTKTSLDKRKLGQLLASWPALKEILKEALQTEAR